MADSGVWREMQAVLKAEFPTLVITSTYRAGSITATGNTSYHSRGMAVDMAPRMEVFQWIKDNYGASTKELIFSPAGNGQIRNGAPHYYGEPTRGDHWDHVHWAIESLGSPGGVSGGGDAGNNPLVPDEIEILAKFYEYVTDPGVWLRVGLAVAGAALLVMAFVSMSKRPLNLRMG